MPASDHYDDELLGKLIKEGNTLFEAACKQKHEEGAETYGELGFLANDTLRMAMDELVDLSNYARYTFIKLWVLICQLEDYQAEQSPIGPQAFVSNMGKEQ